MFRSYKTVFRYVFNPLPDDVVKRQVYLAVARQAMTLTDLVIG